MNKPVPQRSEGRSSGKSDVRRESLLKGRVGENSVTQLIAISALQNFLRYGQPKGKKKKKKGTGSRGGGENGIQGGRVEKG